MGKKRRILLAVLGVAVLAVVVWMLMPSPEPVYQGKPLSHWLEGYDSGNYTIRHPHGPPPPTRGEADEAIRQIGTNAVPILLRMLRVPNPTLTDRVLAVAQKQHFVKIPFAPANLNIKALDGFGALDSGASNAVPSLMAIFESDRSPFSQTAVPAILGGIGPAAEQAVPVLLRGIAHTNELVRNNAIFALGQIHAQPKLVVPALIKCLNDPEAIIRAKAAWALGRFGKDAQSAVPALLELRRKEALNPDPANRTTMPMLAGYATTWGVRYRAVGSAWGPLLGISSNSSNLDVVGCTIEALDKIDPEAAARADLK